MPGRWHRHLPTGPANSQFIIKVLTDNKNRSASAIRHIFAKYGGSLGAVMWNFEQKGVIRIKKENLININDDDLELELIDLGVDDILKEKEGITIYCNIQFLQKIKKYFEEKNIKTESAEIEYIAKDKIQPNKEEEIGIDKIIEELEENEDISDYYINL